MEIISDSRGRTIKSALVRATDGETEDEIIAFAMAHHLESEPSLFGWRLHKITSTSYTVDLYTD